ncbi:MAG: hypothetical protein IH602_14900 [Bryobacteraceae bacterium]|nr:hypothetical protein [Bryobacteraceae bacterium]
MTALFLCLLLAAPPEDPRQSIMDRAAAVPPEVAAELYIKLADSGYPLDKKKRLEMLEDAWRMAGLAKMEMPPKMAVNGMNTDTDAGRILGSPRLDKLTLRVRAIRAMLPLDRKTAMERLEEMPVPAPPRAPCESALTGAPDPYFELLRDLGAADRLMLDLRALTVPEQLAPAIKAVLNIRRMDKDLRDLMVVAWAGSLKGMNGSFRSYYSSRDELNREFSGLTKHIDLFIPSFPKVPEAIAEYDARHWAGEVCADRAKDPQAAKAEKIGPGPKNPSYWSNPAAAKVMAEMKALRFGTPEQQAEYNKRPRMANGMAHFLPIEMRKTSEWETAMRKYLYSLEEWKKDDNETDRSWFHQRAMSYSAVLAIVPDGPMRQGVVQSYITFLNGAAMKQESPAEWLLAFDYLREGRGADTGAAEGSVEAEVRRSGDGLMNLILDARQVLKAK